MHSNSDESCFTWPIIQRNVIEDVAGVWVLCNPLKVLIIHAIWKKWDARIRLVGGLFIWIEIHSEEMLR